LVELKAAFAITGCVQGKWPLQSVERNALIAVAQIADDRALLIAQLKAYCCDLQWVAYHDRVYFAACIGRQRGEKMIEWEEHPRL
jgi:hypothetical protein